VLVREATVQHLRNFELPSSSSAHHDKRGGGIRGVLLSFQQVTKDYGTCEGVRNLTVSIDHGEVVGLLGPNGSGKTTMLRLAAGMLRATRGEVRVLGMNSRSQRGHFAFLPSSNAYPEWMASGDIERLMKGIYNDFDSGRFEGLLSQLKVPDRPFKALSRGNQTKLALATTLARKVDLYLLDEPLAGIDLLTRESIIGTLISEWRAEASVILSTHEIKEAENLLDRAIFLDQGEIVFDDMAAAIEARGDNLVELYRQRMR
jgi:ABC-2 type transport system ATP-binding protein